MAYNQSPGRMNMPKTGRGLDAPALMEGKDGFKPSKNAFKTVAEGSKPASVSSRFSGDPVKEMEKNTSSYRQPGTVKLKGVTGNNKNQVYDSSTVGFKSYATDKKGGIITERGKPVQGEAIRALSEMAYKQRG